MVLHAYILIKRLRQKDGCKFEISSVYTVSLNYIAGPCLEECFQCQEWWLQLLRPAFGRQMQEFTAILGYTVSSKLA